MDALEKELQMLRQQVSQVRGSDRARSPHAPARGMVLEGMDLQAPCPTAHVMWKESSRLFVGGWQEARKAEL